MKGERLPNLDRKYPVRTDKTPAGRCYCRVCGGVCPPRCTSYCSEFCRKTAAPYWSIETMKNVVFKRDGGRCQECGMDIDRLMRIIGNQPKGDHGPRYYPTLRYLPTVKEWLKAEGFDLHTYVLYHIDHVVPVVEGGLCEPENLRTLCHPCHKAVTKAMHRRRKIERAVAPVRLLNAFTRGLTAKDR